MRKHTEKAPAKIPGARILSGLILLTTLLGFGGWACTDEGDPSPLSDASLSPEALAEAALEALVAGDEEALDRLRVTRDEYEFLLWPVLPDGNYVPFDFVWSLTGPRSRKARREVMGNYRGIPMQLVSVDLGEESESYASFTLHREARMTVRRLDTGALGLLPLMDVVVEMGGGWKFLNFGENL